MSKVIILMQFLEFSEHFTSENCMLALCCTVNSTYTTCKSRGKKSGHHWVDSDVLLAQDGGQLAGHGIKSSFANSIAKKITVLKEERLESVRIGKCQNAFFFKIGKCQNAFFFKIGKCQNRKVLELESVRIGKCQNWKVSELESVRIEKCQNQRVSELESVRIIWSIKIPYTCAK